MNGNDFSKIEGKIGYKFRNKDLLQQAFVRRSYSQENGGADNEVLEFIGDKVLDLIVVKCLSEEYGDFAENYDGFNPNGDFNEYLCDYRESKLTELKRVLVEGGTLADRIDVLGFSEYMILGKGDIKNKVYNKRSVKEDLFEAILGAVALDCDWDIDVLYEVVDIMLDPFSYISDDIEDQYVSIVQKWAFDNYGYYPEYSFGDYRTHFKHPICIRINSRSSRLCELILDDEMVFWGCGSTDSEARRDAAKAAYVFLAENDLLTTIQDEIENPNEQQAINQLETLARRGYFELPKYKFTETHDKNGNPIWQVTCIIDDFDKVFNATSSSKKAAKKTAAYRMLNYVLDNYDEEE